MQNDQTNTPVQNQNNTAPSTMGAGGLFESAQTTQPTITTNQTSTPAQNIDNESPTELNSLEQPPETEQNIDQTASSLPVAKKSKFSKPILIIILVSIVIVGSAAAALGLISSKQASKLQSPSQSVGEQGIVLNDKTTDTLSVLQLKGSQNKLIVNGDLVTLGRIAIRGGSYYGQFIENNLSANREYVLPDSSGTLCLDTNNCNFANSSNVVNSINGAKGSLSLGVGLSMQGSTIVNSQTPTNVNGFNGNVVVQGTTNQINVSNSAGKVTLSTPQDIATTSSPTFNSLTLTATGTQNGNVICDISNNCGYAGGGNYFAQNGNSFGATANIGTNDSYGLNLKTAGNIAVAIDTSGNAIFSKKLQVGTAGGTIDQCASLLGSVDCTVGIDNSIASTETSNASYGTFNYLSLSPASDNAGGGYGAQNMFWAGILNTKNFTGTQGGAYNWGLGLTSGTINYLSGSTNAVQLQSAGTLTYGVGVDSQINSNIGTITNAYGLRVQSAIGSGSITNNYGILVGNQTLGSNDYGVAIGAADTQTLWLSNTANLTSSQAGIAFGSSRDTNLYRSATSTLKTDNKFAVGTLGTTDTAAYLCLNSSSILAACSGTSTGSAFVQGGNSFGATAILGTNDSNPLTLVTNGSEVARLTTGGTLEVNSTGTPGTVEKLRVNTPATVDNSANVILSADAATSKPLVVQGAPSQTANLQEWQDSTGTVLASIGSSGLITVQAGATVSGNTINLNASSDSATNINTGTSTGAVNIGNSAAGAIALQSASTVGITGTTSVTGLNAGSATTLTVNNSTGTGNVLALQDNGTNVLTVADGGNLSYQLASGVAGNLGTAFTIDNRNNYDDALNINSKGATVLNVTDEGRAVFQNNADGPGNFQIRNAVGSPLLAVDTSNGRVKIGGGAAATAKLEVVSSSTNTAAGDDIAGRFSISDTGVVASGIDTTYGLLTSASRTGATGGTINTYGLNAAASGDTGGTSSSTGVYGTATGADTNIGVQGWAYKVGTASLTSVIGVNALAGSVFGGASGNVTSAIAIQGLVSSDGSGAVFGSTAGLNIMSTSLGGDTSLNNYGINVAAQTAGTNDYGVAIGAADTQTLWLSSNADNTTANAGIALGLSRDTNLYRFAASTLKTDGAFALGGATNAVQLTVKGNASQTANLQEWQNSSGTPLAAVDAGGRFVATTLGSADSATYLCRNTSNQIATCSGTSSGSAFVQGGNSFGATAALGTNDSNSLTFKTNGSTQATIAVGGATTFKNSANSTSAFQIQNAASGILFNVDTTNSGVSVANAGLAGTVQIGNTTGAVAQTINIGNNATASSSTTLNLGSAIGASATTLQGGTSGITFKTAGTTACTISGANQSLSCPGAGASSERFGAGSAAAGNNSISVGNGASAAGANAVAIGKGATPSSDDVAIGYLAASGGQAVAIGSSASALGYGTAIGYNAKTLNTYSLAIGSSSNIAVNATRAIALGYGANVTQQDSLAIGHSASVTGGGSIAIGSWASAPASGQLVVGSYVTAISNAYIGNGVTNATPGSLTLHATGSSTAGTAAANLSLQGGNAVSVSNTNGGALFLNGGQGTGTATGGDIVFQYSPAGTSGSSNNALQTACTISGTNGSLSCPGAGASSERFGSGATAAGSDTVAIGNGASAGQVSGVAIGRNASSGSQSGSTAIGSGASATGQSAVLVGSGATSSGNVSVTIGHGAVGGSNAGIAIGASARTNGGFASIAIGYNAATSAAVGSQLVVGGPSSASGQITNGYFGSGVTDTAPVSFTLHATGSSTASTAGASLSLQGGNAVAINNTNGGALYLNGGQGTGTGVGGNINLQIAKAGTTGSSNNALTTVATISGTDGSALFKNSTNGANALAVKNAAGTTTYFRVDTSESGGADQVAQFTGASGNQCTVIAGTGWSCTSDRNLKTNISGIQGLSALDVISKLNPVTYNWLSDPNGTQQDGFIAQDVQQVLPELVGTDSNGHLTLNKDGILPYVVGAVQAQQNQIQGIDTRVQTGQANTTSLDGRVTTLEQQVSQLLAGQGNSNFGSLNVSGAASVQNLTVTGAATIAQLTVTGDAQIAGNLTVGGHVLGNSDTRGTITIPAGQTQFKFTFVKPYTAGSQPNVILTPKNTFAPSYRVDSTDKDFTVYFETPATADVQMNYQVQE